MASIDNCVNLLLEEGDLFFSSYVNRLEKFHKRIKNLKNLKVLMNSEIIGPNKENNGFNGLDPSKILVSTRNTNITATNLSELLLDKYKIQIEMASTDYIIAMTSICDTNSGFIRLSDALLDIDRQVKYKAKADVSWLDLNSLYQEADVVMTSYDAMNSQLTYIPFKESEGRITGEYIYLYPPGIPILVPGERITNTHLSQLQKYREIGLQIQGLVDYNLNQIKVVS